MAEGAKKRQATREELRAVANPLRLRILRLCLHEELTNKELAERLRKDPGSLHHHVRMLVDTGFLEVTGVRSSPRGALEKPYRATGKSWTIDVGDPSTRADLAMLDALRAELLEAEDAPGELMASRLGLRLSAASATELRARLADLLEEYSKREDADGDLYGLFVVLHPRSSGRGDSSARGSGCDSGGRSARSIPDG